MNVKVAADQPSETVQLIDWANAANNDFAIAEEVTLHGDLERRPDLVLYLNGIAFGVIELKNSRVSVESGIRQSLSNQQPQFNSWFFSTVQFVFAGNDSQGLRYGTILTPEKFFLPWKEDEQDNSRFKLDKYVVKMCNQDRVLELMRYFIIFDKGIKKLPRPHQYFAVKAAQNSVVAKEGGIIWNTMGSGKSIVMVVLARWILESNPHARVAIITDRDELDKQIEGVFAGTGNEMVRATSGADLIANLGMATPRLICSLIHKFGVRQEGDFDQFIKDLGAKSARTVGEIYVFVDECHRTQGGKLHRAMKAIMPKAIFYGFTGTPLLKKDRATTIETFGRYVHTYKYSEGVEDGVVLDMVYQSRDIEQSLSDQAKIDAWFDAKTAGLNDYKKAALRAEWGTMQQVLSSKERMDRIVEDIVFDFAVKPELSDPENCAQAMLVTSSVYEACRYFELFDKTSLKGKVALVTSYSPYAGDVTLEEIGENTETAKQFIYNTYELLLGSVNPDPGKNKAETYRDWAKAAYAATDKPYSDNPGRLRLMIVVDMCLTGYDAPQCTYMYLDKPMQDHALFQAITRTTRVAGSWKLYGQIVDYKQLFSKVQNAIGVYNSELDETEDGVSPQVVINNRLEEGRKRLESALETIEAVCEPVRPPKSELEFIQYFCGNIEVPTEITETEPRRAALYGAVLSLVRAWANIADDTTGAGYSDNDSKSIKTRVEQYAKLRDTIRNAAGEIIDLKAYEADMRYLIDTYITAKAPIIQSTFANVPLLQIIARSSVEDAVKALPDDIQGNKEAVAETIINNVRSTIVKEHLNDPAFYDKMSNLLAAIVQDLRAKTLAYKDFLAKVGELAKTVVEGPAAGLPAELVTPGSRAIFNNLTGRSEDKRLELALNLDIAIKENRPADWRGNMAREQVVKRAMYEVLGDAQEVEDLFAVIKQQRDY